jgi:hypothetical protein
LASGARSITDQIQEKKSLPPQLQALIDTELMVDGAKQRAADISATLRDISLSIANADPSNLPDPAS